MVSVIVAVLITRRCYKNASQKTSNVEEVYEAVEMTEEIEMTDHEEIEMTDNPAYGTGRQDPEM